MAVAVRINRHAVAGITDAVIIAVSLVRIRHGGAIVAGVDSAIAIRVARTAVAYVSLTISVAILLTGVEIVGAIVCAITNSVVVYVRARAEGIARISYSVRVAIELIGIVRVSTVIARIRDTVTVVVTDLTFVGNTVTQTIGAAAASGHIARPAGRSARHIAIIGDAVGVAVAERR